MRIPGTLPIWKYNHRAWYGRQVAIPALHESVIATRQNLANLNAAGQKRHCRNSFKICIKNVD